MTTNNKKSEAAKGLEVIEEKFVNGPQSIELIGLYRLNNLKLKIHIDRDSYDVQSSATILVWKVDELRWSIVTSLHNSEMKVCKGQCGGPGVFCYTKVDRMSDHDRMLFKLDKDHLVTLAKEILF